MADPSEPEMSGQAARPVGEQPYPPDLSFHGVDAAALSARLDLQGRAVLRDAVPAARLAAFAADAAALAPGPGLAGTAYTRRHPGRALTDILPAPEALQLLQELLGAAYVLLEARLLPVGTGLPAVSAADPLLLWLPLPGAGMGSGPPVADPETAAPGDILLLRGAAAPSDDRRAPVGPAVVLAFAASAPAVPALAQALSRAVARIVRDHAADAADLSDAAREARGADLVIAFARLLRQHRPADLLPPLRAALEEAHRLPPGTPRWAMPEHDPAPAAGRPPAPAGTGFGLVLAVRNHAVLLRRALDGLAAQTRPFDQMVLVDDASEDDSLDHLLAFAAGRPEVEVLRNETRQGGVASIGPAVDRLRTGYLTWAAADDLLLPHALARLADSAAASPDAALVLGETGVAILEGTAIGPVGSMSHGGADLGALAPYLAPDDLPGILSCRRLSFGTAWAMRRDAVAAAGGFDPELGSLADFFTGLVLLCRHGLAVIPERLSVMSVSPSSFSRVAGADPAAMTASRDRFLQRLKDPGFRDVYWRLAATPSLIMDLQSAAELFSTYFAWRPQHWDLMLRALEWGLRHGALSIDPGR